MGSNTNSEPTNCYNALLKYLAHLGRRAKRRLWRQYKQYRKRKRREANQRHSGSSKSTKRNSIQANHHQLVKKSSSSSTNKEISIKENSKELDVVHESAQDTCIELQPIEQSESGTASLRRLAGSAVDLEQLQNDQLISSTRLNEPDRQRPLISCLRTNRTEHIICPISEPNATNHLSIQTTLSTSHSANCLPVNNQRNSNLANCLATTNFSNNNGNAAVLAAGRGRRHGSVPTLYLRPNRSETNCSSNFLVSTLDGNYLTTARRNQTSNHHLNSTSMQLNLSPNQPSANSLHWSPRPTLIRSTETGQLEEEQFQLKFEKADDDSEDDEVEREYEQWVNYIEQTWWFRLASQTKRILQIIVDHRYFQRFIFLSILINTLSMGAEYHDQPASLTAAVEWFNLFFTGIFMLEMILKLIAHGCYVYISDGFNVFDGIVVIVRYVVFRSCYTF